MSGMRKQQSIVTEMINDASEQYQAAKAKSTEGFNGAKKMAPEWILNHINPTFMSSRTIKPHSSNGQRDNDRSNSRSSSSSSASSRTSASSSSSSSYMSALSTNNTSSDEEDNNDESCSSSSRSRTQSECSTTEGSCSPSPSPSPHNGNQNHNQFQQYNVKTSNEAFTKHMMNINNILDSSFELTSGGISQNATFTSNPNAPIPITSTATKGLKNPPNSSLFPLIKQPLPAVCQALHSTNPSVPTPPTRKRQHRISLPHTYPPNPNPLTPRQQLSLLQNHPLLSESSALSNEISKLSTEISNLSEESTLLSNLVSSSSSSNTPLLPSTPPPQRADRDAFRHARGLCFRVKMTATTPSHEGERAKRAFLSRCGGRSRARNVTHVSLIGPSSFFLRRDSKKWHVHGSLPKNFRERWEREDPKGALEYLSVGPRLMGQGEDGVACYYAQWTTGDCWWTGGDEGFSQVVRAMDVHRVAFGVQGSWVVLGRDGRCAWRGIPKRLERRLMERGREMPAACDVSLGAGGAFFVAFLDGENDYFLPAKVANQCDDVERRGGRVTGVSLHVDCHDFIIRHVELDEQKGQKGPNEKKAKAKGKKNDKNINRKNKRNEPNKNGSKKDQRAKDTKTRTNGDKEPRTALTSPRKGMLAKAKSKLATPGVSKENRQTTATETTPTTTPKNHDKRGQLTPNRATSNKKWGRKSDRPNNSKSKENDGGQGKKENTPNKKWGRKSDRPDKKENEGGQGRKMNGRSRTRKH